MLARELSDDEAEHLWQEIEHHRVDYTREVSDDELTAVAGGGGGIYRDCVAMVEDDSWCWSNDGCTEFQNRYECYTNQYIIPGR